LGDRKTGSVLNQNVALQKQGLYHAGTRTQEIIYKQSHNTQLMMMMKND